MTRIVAITRAVSPHMAECELTFAGREPIDLGRAVAQHEQYERWLTAHGCTLVHAEAAPEHPDSVFIEDTAFVLDDFAVMTHPGAASRRGEVKGVARALERFREIRWIEPPATIDGGDVLRIGQTLYVGRSTRTNDDAVAQLRAFGCDVVRVDLRGCLHLKSAVTALDDHTLLLNREWVDPFGGFDVIDVEEPHAANVLRIDGTILMSDSHPRTRAKLEERGYRVETLPMSEMEKAEGAVTCCSLIVPVP